MELRKANEADIITLKEIYKDIVINMKVNNLEVWDEIYPCEFLEEDIKKNKFYVLFENEEILGGFTLNDTNTGEASIKWIQDKGKAYYIDKLGVNVKHGRRGVGGRLLEEALNLVKEKGGEYLRLFVVDENLPAISFYEKNGYIKAEGLYEEVIDENFTLHEYGYEIEVSKNE